MTRCDSDNGSDGPGLEVTHNATSQQHKKKLLSIPMCQAYLTVVEFDDITLVGKILNVSIVLLSGLLERTVMASSFLPQW